MSENNPPNIHQNWQNQFNNLQQQLNNLQQTLNNLQEEIHTYYNQPNAEQEINVQDDQPINADDEINGQQDQPNADAETNGQQDQANASQVQQPISIFQPLLNSAVALTGMAMMGIASYEATRQLFSEVFRFSDNNLPTLSSMQPYMQFGIEFLQFVLKMSKSN